MAHKNRYPTPIYLSKEERLAIDAQAQKLGISRQKMFERIIAEWMGKTEN